MSIDNKWSIPFDHFALTKIAFHGILHITSKVVDTFWDDQGHLKREARGNLVVVGSLSPFQIPLNPPFLKGEISHNDLDGTAIKAAKIYKTAGLEIKDTLRKCQQEN